MTAERTNREASKARDFPERLYLGHAVPERPRYAAPLLRTDYPEGRVRPDILIANALAQVATEGRNRAGLNCALQFRDNRYSLPETEAYMRNGYLPRVPETDRQGKRQPYTNMEMQASIRSAYSRPAREPWLEREPRRSR